MTKPDPIVAELQRRKEMWEAVEAAGTELTPKKIDSIGIRPAQTGQGIYRDQRRTRSLAPPEGVTLTLLDLGTTYADAFDSAGGLYHYPSTDRGDRDKSEVEATKNCRRLKLPLFVILAGSTPRHRTVRLGWIADWDDEGRMFLVDFSGPSSGSTKSPNARPFKLKDHRAKRRVTTSAARPGQSRFRFEVFKLRGAECEMCEVRLKELLEAVHICPHAEGGTDDPRNGLVMCRNHHRGFDLGFFAFDTATGGVLYAKGGPGEAALAITKRKLASRPPHEALAWRLKGFVASKR